MTVNQFVKKLGEAGFNFSFRASDSNISLTGECVQLKDSDFKITTKRNKTAQECRQEINRMLRND